MDLRGRNGSGALVPEEPATQHRLLETLQTRLPDLDNEAIIRAMAGTDDARFLICPPQDELA